MGGEAFPNQFSSSWVWKKSNKVGPEIYSGPRYFISLSHREDLPVSGEDQSDSDRAEDSEGELEGEVTDSEEDDLTFDSKQF